MTKTLPFVKTFIGQYSSGPGCLMGAGREYWEEALAVGATLGLGSDIQSSSQDSAGGERASDPGLPPGLEEPPGAGIAGWRLEAVAPQAAGRASRVGWGRG